MEQTAKEKYCRCRNRLGSEFGKCSCKNPKECEYGPPTLAELKRQRVYNMGIHLRAQVLALLGPPKKKE